MANEDAAGVPDPLTADQQRIAQIVFEHFRAHGRWPFSRDIAARTRELGSFWSIMDGIHWYIFQSGEKRDSNAIARLGVEGIARCEGGEAFLRHFVAALQFCVARYFERPRDATVTGQEMHDTLQLEALELTQVLDLLTNAYRVCQGHTGVERPEEMKISLDPDIDRFLDVKTLADYLAIAVAERERAIPAYRWDEGGSVLVHVARVCRADLARAQDRYLTGDYTGAITSACGAVDALTGALYRKFDLGDAARTSFAAKVNTIVDRCRVFERLHADLITLGMPEPQVDQYITHRREVLKHTAEALAILRRCAGDVHGSKSAPAALAFDAIRQAELLGALLAPFCGT